MRSTTRSTSSLHGGSRTSPQEATSQPELLIEGASSISPQMTLPDRDSGISSLGSAAGLTHSDSQASQTPQTSGPGRVRASRSPTRARGAEHATLDIFGQHGSSSSASADLQRSLESRLRAATDLDGSILFALTWNDAVTPSGHRICALRASARRTSGSASTSWPTPQTRDGDYSYRNGDHDQKTLKLGGIAKLSAWPTALARDAKGKTSHTEGGACLGTAASWATPAAHEAGGTPAAQVARKRKSRANGSSLGESVTSLALQVQMTHGVTPNGSPVPTESRGQLNPDLSRWLQGFPAVWGYCGATETR